MFLSDELVSSLGEPDSKPTLLEDLEALHRSLKELESVKGYVQVVEHALKLRCVSLSAMTPSLRVKLSDCTVHAARRRSNKCAAQAQ